MSLSLAPLDFHEDGVKSWIVSKEFRDAGLGFLERPVSAHARNLPRLLSMLLKTNFLY
jgi:hypothetical protein